MAEQDIINKYFSRHLPENKSVVLGVGDDAAIVSPEKDTQLVITTDTLNIDQHFYADHSAEHLGQKALAVNLSDIAAMGGTPRWATLSLSILHIDHEWLDGFSKGLYKLADQYDVKIIGGDLVKGPLSITMQIIGELYSHALQRSACRVNDLIYVTGCLGDAAFGLRLLRNQSLKINLQDRQYFLDKITAPEPQLDASKIIAKYSKAAIDISDGLLIDLKRMLDMSQTGAVLNIDKFPLSGAMQKYIHDLVDLQDIMLGGEDYQLLFTIPAKSQNQLEKDFHKAKLPIANIGKIISGNDIQLIQDGKNVELPKQHSFDHFA
ncbi:MAG: thiamine-phosphate kinase [Pseudomonadota bacterium]